MNSEATFYSRYVPLHLPDGVLRERVGVPEPDVGPVGRALRAPGVQEATHCVALEIKNRETNNIQSAFFKY